MADVTLTYNGQNILEMSASGTRTLKTAGKICKTDIDVAYVRPSGPGSNLRRGFGPFIGRLPEDSCPGGIASIVHGESLQLASVLGQSFVGYNTVLIIGGGMESEDIISGDTQFQTVYKSTGNQLRVFFGKLGSNTTITNPNEAAPLLFQSIVIADGFTVSINNSLTGYVPGVQSGSRAEIDNGYLLTDRGFRVGAKLPANYGIMAFFSNYDYANAEVYQPAIWEPVDRFIRVPEIELRRIQGSYRYTAFASFLKVDPAAYIQYFNRASANGKFNTETTLDFNDKTGLQKSPYFPALNDWKDIPMWTNSDLEIAFVDVTQSNQA